MTAKSFSPGWPANPFRPCITHATSLVHMDTQCNFICSHAVIMSRVAAAVVRIAWMHWLTSSNLNCADGLPPAETSAHPRKWLITRATRTWSWDASHGLSNVAIERVPG